MEVVEIRSEPKSLNGALDVTLDMSGFIGDSAVLKNSNTAF